MVIHPWSALFGAVIAAALFIIFNKLYYGLFGGKELRKLKKENKALQQTINDKEKYIRKSLEALEEESRAQKGLKEGT
ncbi:hypothetical protein ACFL5L_05455 [candidate division KSB1 bacterium]